ncbi:MAG: L-threonylcarbamoyladenylate synthase [Bacteroidota bacterium]
MDQEIKKCLKVLQDGGTILYPTDTIWGIGCDATNDVAVEKVYCLKKRMESKNLIILVEDQKRLHQYITAIPDIAWDLLSNVNSPLTIVFPDAKNLAKKVVAADQSIAIRIVKSGFCHQLISAFGKPIVSTSANISGEAPPKTFRHISAEIIAGVDYVVKERMDFIHIIKPSQIIKINANGEFRIIRE